MFIKGHSTKVFQPLVINIAKNTFCLYFQPNSLCIYFYKIPVLWFIFFSNTSILKDSYWPFIVLQPQYYILLLRSTFLINYINCLKHMTHSLYIITLKNWTLMTIIKYKIYFDWTTSILVCILILKSMCKYFLVDPLFQIEKVCVFIKKTLRIFFAKVCSFLVILQSIALAFTLQTKCKYFFMQMKVTSIVKNRNLQKKYRKIQIEMYIN